MTPLLYLDVAGVVGRRMDSDAWTRIPFRAGWLRLWTEREDAARLEALNAHYEIKLVERTTRELDVWFAQRFAIETNGSPASVEFLANRAGARPWWWLTTVATWRDHHVARARGGTIINVDPLGGLNDTHVELLLALA